MSARVLLSPPIKARRECERSLLFRFMFDTRRPPAGIDADLIIVGDTLVIPNAVRVARQVRSRSRREDDPSVLLHRACWGYKAARPSWGGASLTSPPFRLTTDLQASGRDSSDKPDRPPSSTEEGVVRNVCAAASLAGDRRTLPQHHRGPAGSWWDLTPAPILSHLYAAGCLPESDATETYTASSVERRARRTHSLLLARRAVHSYRSVTRSVSRHSVHAAQNVSALKLLPLPPCAPPPALP